MRTSTAIPPDRSPPYALAGSEALVDLRNEGAISNETLNKVIRDRDLEESRLEI